MKQYSFINNAHPEFVDQLYQQYQKNPESVEESWRQFFKGFDFASQKIPADSAVCDDAQKEIYVLNLINGYRSRGHFFTKTNPVRERRIYRPTLDLEHFNLSEDDLDTTFKAGNELGIGPAKLQDILDHLNETYCRSIGAEYMFVRTPERVQWLKEHMESTRNLPDFSLEDKRQILHKLNQAVIFENFLHSKYIGQKRFSLEGGETLIPGLDALIEFGSELGIEEFMIGMPHRGRLNVLANILNKTYEEIFSEFEGQEYADSVFGGDVKYHLGYASLISTRKGHKVKVGLAPNPSHLESVNPVVEGMVRAKMDFTHGGDENKIVPILVHGDAAIAAQGVVYEVIQMSELEGYRTGGTIHLVINNQLGFTTNYLDGRSSTYCTDVAKVTRSPVFHVNADDAEAVVFAIRMAIEYRQIFHTDVFIDLLGYRRYGHNEGDEPRFTQPKLYKTIASHPNPREIYKDKLLSMGSLEEDMAKEMQKEFKRKLQESLELVKDRENGGTPQGSYIDTCDDKKRDVWESLDPIPETKVSRKKLIETGEKIFGIPAEITIFDKIEKLYKDRLERLQKGHHLDWAIGEMLAYGTLLTENTPVRLSGQDTERGTFSHRHAVLYDTENEQEYIPLNHMSENQAPFYIYNSLLSEFGVMGFEYGYACANPDGLVIWEAQFGDFNNEAQVIIDQFIASAEAKWNRTNGIVLFLPHGYEGQGPEHSSARIERFLTLCANDNMMVANCSTPANLFHLLRSHVKYPFRIPLILFTPKSLLRHPACVSTIEEFTEAGFQRVIDDGSDPEKVKRVLFCSGKIYYDLAEKKKEDKRDDVAIVRMEQLYPFPKRELKEVLKKYKLAKQHFWVQEEPANAGALVHVRLKFDMVPLQFVSRRESPTPATGFYKQHVSEQKALMDKAFS